MLEHLAPALAQLLEHVAQAHEVVAVAVLHPLLHEPAQRRVQVAVVEEIVGHLVDQRVGVEVEALLGTVPTRVAEAGFRAFTSSESHGRRLPLPAGAHARLPRPDSHTPDSWGHSPARDTGDMPQVRRISWLAIGLLLAGTLGAACSGEGEQAKAPKPFCQAAYDYEQELGREAKKGEKNVEKQLAMVEKMAELAPKKIRKDVDAFVESLRRVQADPSLAKDKKFQARGAKIVDNVNRYAFNGCNFAKQDPSQGI